MNLLRASRFGVALIAAMVVVAACGLRDSAYDNAKMAGQAEAVNASPPAEAVNASPGEVSTATGSVAGPGAESGGQQEGAPDVGEAEATGAEPGGRATAGGGPEATDTVVVGGIFQRSGVINGGGTYEGAAAYFAALNAKGVVNGHKIKFVHYDDGMDSQRNLAAFRRLVEQDRAVVVMNNGDLAGAATVEYSKQQGVPVIGGIGTGQQWYQNANWFPVIANQLWTGSGVVAKAAADKGVKKVANLWINLKEGEIKAQYQRQYAATYGMKVVYDASFSAGEPDFTPYVLRAQAAGAEAIFFVSTVDAVIRYKRAMMQQNYRAMSMFSFAAIDPQLHAEVGEAIEGDVAGLFTAHPSQAPAAFAEYEKAMSQYFPKQRKNAFSYAGWAGAALVAEVLSKIPVGEVTKERIMAEAQRIEGFDASGMVPPIRFGGRPGPYRGSGCDQVLEFQADGSYKRLGPMFTCVEPPSGYTGP